MKVLVPSKHNELLLEDVKIGDTFWLNDELFMKVKGVDLDMTVNIILETKVRNYCAVLKLSTGEIFLRDKSLLVGLDNNICVTELQSEEKMNREINIECRARELYEKIHKVIDSSEYKSVFGLHMIHGGTYTGPTFGEELNRLGEALES